MMKREDCILKVGEAFMLEGGIRIDVSRLSGSRPATVLIGSAGRELELADFAEQRFAPEFAALSPYCEVVRWKGWTFILGLPALVITGPNAPIKCDLFRKPTDDTGFYQTHWIEVNDRIFCIYEGGIVAISSEGEVLWHCPKFWDDTFTGFQDSELVLIESDGQRVALDAATGTRKPPNSDSPPP